MVCPECGAVIRKAFKPDLSMLSKGEWRPTNPGATIRGYHINALYSPWVNLYELVEEWLDANKNKDKTGLQEFINLKLGDHGKKSLRMQTSGNTCTTGESTTRVMTFFPMEFFCSQQALTYNTIVWNAQFMAGAWVESVGELNTGSFMANPMTSPLGIS